MKHLIILLACILTACGATGGGNETAAAVGPVPQPQPQPVALQPGPVTVVIKNGLVGQIRQIAAGADGWAAVGGSADLVLDVNCTLDAADKITCIRYVSEPYNYTVE